MSTNKANIYKLYSELHHYYQADNYSFNIENIMLVTYTIGTIKGSSSLYPAKQAHSLFFYYSNPFLQKQLLNRDAPLHILFNACSVNILIGYSLIMQQK